MVLGEAYNLAPTWPTWVYRHCGDSPFEWLVEQKSYRSGCQKFLYREQARQTWTD